MSEDEDGVSPEDYPVPAGHHPVPGGGNPVPADSVRPASNTTIPMTTVISTSENPLAGLIGRPPRKPIRLTASVIRINKPWEHRRLIHRRQFVKNQPADPPAM